MLQWKFLDIQYDQSQPELAIESVQGAWQLITVITSSYIPKCLSHSLMAYLEVDII